MKKKLVSSILAFCMILSLLPMAVFAVGEETIQYKITVTETGAKGTVAITSGATKVENQDYYVTPDTGVTAVSFTVTAPDDYEVESVTANSQTLTAASAGTYTFTPSADTTIAVTYAAVTDEPTLKTPTIDIIPEDFISVEKGDTTTITVTTDGTVTAESSDEDIATVSVDDKIVTITGVATGDADVTIKAAVGTEYAAKDFTIEVYVSPVFASVSTTPEVKDGTATATITEKDMQDALDKVNEDAGYVSISSFAQTEEKVTSVEVTLPVSAVTTIAESETVRSTTISTNMGYISVPTAALAQIIDQATTGTNANVTYKCEQTDVVTDSDKATTKVTFEVGFYQGNKELNYTANNNSGNISLSFHTSFAAGTKVTVSSNNETVANVTVEQNGYVYFTTPHLSTFELQAVEEFPTEVKYTSNGNLTGGYVTVSGLEANKQYVVQIGTTPGTAQANVITSVWTDYQGNLVVPTQKQNVISVWPVKTGTVSNLANLTLKDLGTFIMYEVPVTGN